MSGIGIDEDECVDGSMTDVWNDDCVDEGLVGILDVECVDERADGGRVSRMSRYT